MGNVQKKVGVKLSPADHIALKTLAAQRQSSMQAVLSDLVSESIHNATSTPKRVTMDDKVKDRLGIRARVALVTVQNILDDLIHDGRAIEADASSGSSRAMGDVEGRVRGGQAGDRAKKRSAG